MKKFLAFLICILLLSFLTSCKQNNLPIISEDVSAPSENGISIENPKQLLPETHEQMENMIYDFLVENYTTAFFDSDLRNKIFTDYYNNKAFDIPKGFDTENGMMAVYFEIYEFLSGELFPVVVMNRPESDAIVHHIFRYIDGQFKEIEAISSSHAFYKNAANRIVLAEGSDMDGFYRFSYLTFENDGFNREIFAEFGEQNSLQISYDYDDVLQVQAEIALDCKEIMPLSSDAINGKFATDGEKYRAVYRDAMDDTEFVRCSKYNSIVVDSFLMGGYSDGKWIVSSDLFHLLDGSEGYYIYVDGEYNGVATGNKMPARQDGPFLGETIIFPAKNNEPPLVDIANIDSGYIGFSGETALDFAALEALDVNSIFYKNEITKLVESRGYDVNMEIIDIYRVDIDCDGQDEVIINASNVYSYSYEGDEFFVSVILMRKLVDGEVQNIFVDGTYLDETKRSVIARNKILGICDFNADGIYEIVVRTTVGDYLEYNIYEFKGNEFNLVLSNGVGD